MERHEITDEQRCATAREVFVDPACQSAALAVLRRLQDAAHSASLSSLLYLAKTEADEEHGNATPEQVLTWLNRGLHLLADVADESKRINQQIRELEGR